MLTNTVIKVTFGDLRAQQISAVIFQCGMLHHTEFDFLWLFIHLRPKRNAASSNNNSEAREWRHDSDKTETNKLEWCTILQISFRAKAGVPKTLVKQKRHLHSLYFPQNTLMLTESRGEFSDFHSIFRLCALRCCHTKKKEMIIISLPPPPLPPPILNNPR